MPGSLIVFLIFVRLHTLVELFNRFPGKMLAVFRRIDEVGIAPSITIQQGIPFRRLTRIQAYLHDCHWRHGGIEDDYLIDRVEALVVYHHVVRIASQAIESKLSLLVTVYACDRGTA
jgi:hypothetical protein